MTYNSSERPETCLARGGQLETWNQKPYTSSTARFDFL